jgi:hypothetical protein
MLFYSLCYFLFGTIEIDALEQQQTEKFETEVKDVDGICPAVAFWGVIFLAVNV